LATQTEAQTRNAFQRGIRKLRDALRIYLLLKNSIQAEDSPDFARELQAFDQVLQPGVQAARDREANRPFNQQDLLRLVWFTKRYQILNKARPKISAFPMRRDELPVGSGKFLKNGLILVGSGRV
jgi:hypothetical protein